MQAATAIVSLAERTADVLPRALLGRLVEEPGGAHHHLTPAAVLRDVTAREDARIGE